MLTLVSSPVNPFYPPNIAVGDQSTYTSGTQQHPPETFWQDPTSDPTALFTAILTVATVGLLFFTAKLWRSTKDAVSDSAEAVRIGRDTLVAENEAFVYLDGFDVDLRTDENYLIARYFSITPRWKNSGNTPTRDLQVSVRFETFYLSPPRDYDYASKLPERSSLFLGPQAMQRSETIVIGDDPVNRHVNRGTNSGPSIAVYGEGTYFTVFSKNKKRIKWCYKLNFGSLDSKSLTVNFIQWGTHNSYEPEYDSMAAQPDHQAHRPGLPEKAWRWLFPSSKA